MVFTILNISCCHIVCYFALLAVISRAVALATCSFYFLIRAFAFHSFSNAFFLAVTILLSSILSCISFCRFAGLVCVCFPMLSLSLLGQSCRTFRSVALQLSCVRFHTVHKWLIILHCPFSIVQYVLNDDQYLH